MVKLLLSTTMDCLKLVEEEVVVETWLSSRTCWGMAASVTSTRGSGGGAGGDAGAGGDGRVAGGSLQRGRECPAFPRLPAGQDGVSHFPPVQPLTPC